MAKSEGLANSPEQKDKAVFYKPWTWFTKRWSIGEVVKGSIAGGLGLIIAASL